MSESLNAHDCIPLILGWIEKNFKSRKILTIAIDGPCGSGKTTLAERLAKEMNAQTVHLDDFYLQPFQRTPQRYAEPGGNLDRERLLKEVLIPLSQNCSSEYQIFDCRTMSLKERIRLDSSQTVIAEGSYSLHPELIDCYDLKIFLKVPKEEQIRRLSLRETPEMMEAFIQKWIPLETAYLDAFHPDLQADLVIEQ
ncbi:MAG: AAA family ATPase [Erysipelotrichaceae bacterium]|nr:AAA family ATPase [Erysipelotrichaceae bacterium]